MRIIISAFYFWRLRYFVLRNHWSQPAIHFISFLVLVPEKRAAKKRNSIISLSFILFPITSKWNRPHTIISNELYPSFVSRGYRIGIHRSATLNMQNKISIEASITVSRFHTAELTNGIAYSEPLVHRNSLTANR